MSANPPRDRFMSIRWENAEHTQLAADFPSLGKYMRGIRKEHLQWKMLMKESKRGVKIAEYVPPKPSVKESNPLDEYRILNGVYHLMTCTWVQTGHAATRQEVLDMIEEEGVKPCPRCKPDSKLFPK